MGKGADSGTYQLMIERPQHDDDYLAGAKLLEQLTNYGYEATKVVQHANQRQNHWRLTRYRHNVMDESSA